MKTTKQYGFAIIEVILVVVLIAFGGAIAWSVHNHATTSVQTPTTTSKVSAPTVPAFKPESQVTDFSSQVPSKPSASPTNSSLNTNSKAHSSLAQFINPSEYQGVRLEDGTIYIGKLTEIKPGQLELKEVYVLVTASCPKPPISTASPSTLCNSLKVNPVNPQPISTVLVAVWSNLQPDNMFVKAIVSFKSNQAMH